MKTNTLMKNSTDTVESPDFNTLFSSRARAIQSSAIREILKVTERPEVISFAGGLPAPETFPVKETLAALERVLTTSGREALQYSTTEGFAPLREWIAARNSTPEAPVHPDQVLMVSGSQQGLDLLAKVLIDPGDTVLVETPTYLGALQSFSLFDPKYVSVASDEDGLLPDALTDAMRDAKFLYCLPNFQNPTGRLLAEDRRYQLAKRARELDLLILEDDPYGALSYDGETPPSIRSLAPERTVYMGSFSKVLAPGLRLGYIVAPAALMPSSCRPSRRPTCTRRHCRRWPCTTSSRMAFSITTFRRFAAFIANSARRCSPRLRSTCRRACAGTSRAAACSCGLNCRRD